VNTTENADSAQPPRLREATKPSAFATTHWSVVLEAGRSDTTHARAALEKLCETYWQPLYAYVRRRGSSAADAEDLTQTFFARLLASHLVARADPERGRFRSYLLTAMNHFLADEWDRLKAQKRGGAQRVVPLDVNSAETRLQLEPADTLTAEKIYERQWVLTLLEKVFDQLCREYEASGNGPLFAELKASLTQARGAVHYADLAERMKVSEGALRVAVHRLRQRYRELLRAEIANTVASPGEVEAELRDLFRVLAG